jgi:hypothetical protein
LQARKWLQDPECLLQTDRHNDGTTFGEMPCGRRTWKEWWKQQMLAWMQDNAPLASHLVQYQVANCLCWQLLWFRFIGVVKTATRLFLKAYLNTIKMPNRGAVPALIGSTDDCELLAFVYCDRDRHYFISTCAKIAGGDPIQHVQLRQMQLVDSYEEPEYQLITHNCPQAAQLY